MKLLFLVTLSLAQVLQAHEAHHSELKSDKPLTRASIFQLGTEWKNQNGEAVKLSDLQGHPRLLVMLYTKCETACPLIIDDLKEIDKEIHSKLGSNVEVTLFSLDSVTETPKSLLAFSTKRKLPANWVLLTSNANAVAELAAALGVRYKRLQNGDYIHSNVIFYLNESGEVVAQKEGLKTQKTKFIEEISKVLKKSEGLEKSD